MGAVDMRLRPPLRSWVGQLQFQRDDTYYRNLGYEMPASVRTRSLDDLLAEMDAADIEWGVIMGRQSEEPLGVIPNDEIADCIARYPDRFVGWVGLDLSRPTEWWLEEIERCLMNPGFKGVSIEPSISKNASIQAASDKRLYPIYEECSRRGVPINITISAQLQARLQRPYEAASPVDLYRVAQDFPKLTIHVAHAAWPFVMEMIGIAFVCRNVWISPDQYMVPRLPGAGEYVKAIGNYFQRRAVFGTAYPSRPHAVMVQEYRALGFDPQTLDNVMSKNALRLMGMA
jgi:predicted TIM-barrel fold metal-dependent hydrolase